MAIQNQDKKPLILDLSKEQLEIILKEWGEPKYRAMQIWHGLYKNLWNSPRQFTNLKKSLRLKLNEMFRFQSLRPGTYLESNDGKTRKTLFHLDDEITIEAVLMRYDKRRTLCISSQVGCAMGCVFCATGQMGFSKNLTRGQIIEQVLFFARELSNIDERVTNIVVMGMGEPFHNYDETMAALEYLSHPDGLNLGARRFTLSTVGLIPAIQRFTKEKKQYNLAISLHAINDDLRSSLLPINKEYPVNELLSACKEYVSYTHRRISFEWALIRGVNDSQDQANELAQRLKIFRFGNSTLCHVNVIPLNPIDDYSGAATPLEQAKLFKSELEAHKIPCTIRISRGSDIQAGCGQLATKT